MRAARREQARNSASKSPRMEVQTPVGVTGLPWPSLPGVPQLERRGPPDPFPMYKEPNPEVQSSPFLQNWRERERTRNDGTRSR